MGLLLIICTYVQRLQLFHPEQNAMHGLEYAGVDHRVHFIGSDGLNSVDGWSARHEENRVVVDLFRSRPGELDKGFQAGAMKAKQNRYAFRPVLEFQAVGRRRVERSQDRQRPLSSWGLRCELGSSLNDCCDDASERGLMLCCSDAIGECDARSWRQERYPQYRQLPERASGFCGCPATIRSIDAKNKVGGVQGGHFGGASPAFGCLNQPGFANLTRHVVDDAPFATVQCRQGVYKGGQAGHFKLSSALKRASSWRSSILCNTHKCLLSSNELATSRVSAKDRRLPTGQTKNPSRFRKLWRCSFPSGRLRSRRCEQKSARATYALQRSLGGCTSPRARCAPSSRCANG